MQRLRTLHPQLPGRRLTNYRQEGSFDLRPFCDGLGACIGHCPEGAIEIVEREAEPYNERKVMEILVTKGRNTILAHLSTCVTIMNSNFYKKQLII